MRALNLSHLTVRFLPAIVAACLCSATLAAAPEDMPKEKSKDKLKQKDKSSTDSKYTTDPNAGADPKVKLSSEQRWLQQVKEVLAPGEEEWRVLAPRVERVINLEHELTAGKDSHGPHEPKLKTYAPDDPRAQPSDAADKAKALNASLFDPQANAAFIRQQIAAVREARARVRAELTTAQDQLRELLTTRQEAALMIMGLLD